VSRPGKKRRAIFRRLHPAGENKKIKGSQGVRPLPGSGGARGLDPSVREKQTPNERASEAIVKLAVESWRFIRVFERAVSGLDAKEAARCGSAAGAFRKKIEEALTAMDMRMVGIEGTTFDPGIAATPLNIEDFGPGDELEVDAMVEPIIMNRGGLVRMGSVILRKVKT
jgi:hypothetical protein